MISKVYTICKTRQDLSALERFGELAFVNARYIYGDELTDDNEIPTNFADRIRFCSQRFRPDLDYLALVGDHLAIAAMVAELALLHQRFRVLRYDRIAQGYYPVAISAGADEVELA